MAPRAEELALLRSPDLQKRGAPVDWHDPTISDQGRACELSPSRLLRLFMALFLALFLCAAGYDASEGVNHYDLAQNLVRNGTLGMKHTESTVFTRGPDGRMYAMHEIGNALTMVPWIVAGNAVSHLAGKRLKLDKADRLSAFLVCLNGPLELAAMATAFFWILVRRFRVSSAIAMQTCAALAFGTTLFPYSKLAYDGLLLSALLVGALACAWAYEEQPRLWLAALAGCFLGYGVITKIPAVFFIPAITWCLAAASWRAVSSRTELAKVLAAAGLPLLAAAIWQGYYNQLRTGHFWLPPVLTGHSAEYHTFRGAHFFTALAGVLVSPGKSIFLYSPPLLIGIAGWWLMYREHRGQALTLAGFVLPFFLWQCSWKYWTGDWGWGPRYFLIVVAPLMLPAAFWLKRATRARRLVWAAVLAWGFVIQTAAVWNNWEYRFAVLVQSGHTEAEMIWSPRYNLWVDAILNVGRNLERMAGQRAWDALPGSSPLHTQAVNTINVWWLNTPLSPRGQAVLLLGIVLLSLLDFFLWRKLLGNANPKLSIPAPLLDGHPAPVP
jgi:hypothetical protein